MPRVNSSVTDFLDALARELQTLLAQPETISVSEGGGERETQDLIWCAYGLSVDPECRIQAGAPRETWERLSHAEASGPETGDLLQSSSAALAGALQRAAQEKFGSEVKCQDLGVAEPPPGEWPEMWLAINPNAPLRLAINPALEGAFGGVDSDVSGKDSSVEARGSLAALRAGIGDSAGPMGILMHVEVPVSVSFGHAQMRMKDLLNLANGSIVELEEDLGEAVEIRVNNRLIARGEVVAVEGNYGVRVLELVSGQHDLALSGALPHGAGKRES